MKHSAGVRFCLPCGLAACALIGFILGSASSQAQSTAPVKKGAPAPASGPAGKKTPVKTGPAAAAKRPALTQDDVKKLWAQGDQDLLLNEVRIRDLAFEPEEEWVAALPNRAAMPAAAAELAKRIPPAPAIDAVAAQAPDLLAKLKDAAQKRSELEMEPLVHPDLLQNKAKVYTLFDTANYRSHVLGKFSQQDNRRVGAQFFQLTTSQVETLHYVLFSSSHGKIVVRDVITGPDVAGLFLADEQKVALNKLNLMFRALNDGDDTGLKNICTPGLFDSLKGLAGDTKAVGTFITKGQMRTVETSTVKASVPLDQKSIRVVVRIGFATRTGRQMQFDVDFERIDNDLKIVRLRDVENRVVAWDPNIDNYLNRRYGLPDGPIQDTDTVLLSEIIVPLSRIHAFAERALDSRNAKNLKEYSDEFVESNPTSGEGYGLRAAAQFLLANYDEAETDAVRAVERGGTAYFYVMRHILNPTTPVQFFPVVLGISKQKIEYRPPAGQGASAREEIPISSIDKVEFEKGNLLAATRPFMKLEFRLMDTPKKDKKTYNFAAYGTKVVQNPGAKGTGLIPGLGNDQIVPPANWERGLIVVQKTIQAARAGASGTQKNR